MDNDFAEDVVVFVFLCGVILILLFIFSWQILIGDAVSVTVIVATLTAFGYSAGVVFSNLLFGREE